MNGGDYDPFAQQRQQDAERAKAATRPYSIVVGALFLIVIAIAGISLLSRGGHGALGLPDGANLPKFAAPSATGALQGDANVFQNRKQAGRDHVPACEVRGRDVVRICDYFDRPLVLIAWFSRCGNCERQLDTVERVRKRFPKVAFVGLDIRDSQHKARQIVTDHSWGFPMAVDRDGAVSRLYGVGVGPTIFFAYPGGVLGDTAIGELDEKALERRVRDLVRASAQRSRVKAAGGG
jgi:thiol-disulfide isomerase/thioredoxin